MSRLTEQIDPGDHIEWIKEIDVLKIKHPSLDIRKSDKLLPQQIIKELSDITKGEAIIATGVGQHQMWAAQHYKFKEPRSWISSGGSGAMGFEVPGAMGAQVGSPDKTVWSIAGDGGFQMTMCDLATLAENKKPVKFAILNNNYLGMVRQWKEMFYNKDYVASTYSANPDFVKLAKAFGIFGTRVTKQEEITAAIHEAMDFDGPAIVDFIVEQEENVYPMIPGGGSIHDMIEEPKPKELLR